VSCKDAEHAGSASGKIGGRDGVDVVDVAILLPVIIVSGSTLLCTETGRLACQSRCFCFFIIDRGDSRRDGITKFSTEAKTLCHQGINSSH
jgi:hypothetical protein